MSNFTRNLYSLVYGKSSLNKVFKKKARYMNNHPKQSPIKKFKRHAVNLSMNAEYEAPLSLFVTKPQQKTSIVETNKRFRNKANPTFLNCLSNDSKPKGNNTKNLVSLCDSFQETSSGYSYFRKEKESPNDCYQAPPSKIVIQKKQRSNDRLVNRNINNNSKILTSRSQALLNRVQNCNIQKHQRKKTADEKDKYSKFMNEAKKYMERTKIKVNDLVKKLKQAKLQIAKQKETCEEKDAIINEIQQTNKELVQYIEHLRKNRADRMYYQMFDTNHLKKMADEESKTNSAKKSEPHDDHLISSSTLCCSSSFTDMNMSIEECFELLNMLTTRLQQEQYERLKTEEQYQLILNAQIQQTKAIEDRERMIREKLKQSE